MRENAVTRDPGDYTGRHRLHRQDNELDTTGPYRHRYVTEWIADD